MADFRELKDKADDELSRHSDQAKQGIEKAGDAAENRFGQNKVDPVEQKATSYIDQLDHDGATSQQ